MAERIYRQMHFASAPFLGTIEARRVPAFGRALHRSAVEHHRAWLRFASLSSNTSACIQRQLC